MKKSLITIVAAAAMLFAGSSARAQGPMGGPGDFDPSKFAEMRAGQMKESLKLTDEQYTKIVDIFKKEMDEMQKSMESGQRPDFEAMQAQREKQEAAIKAVLTEEQAKAWEKEQEERRGQGGPGGPGGPGMGGPGGPGPR